MTSPYNASKSPGHADEHDKPGVISLHAFVPYRLEPVEVGADIPSRMATVPARANLALPDQLSLNVRSELQTWRWAQISGRQWLGVGTSWPLRHHLHQPRRRLSRFLWRDSH